MEFSIPLNITGIKSTRVDESLTADIIGSGNVKVFATPMMIALMEAAALEAVEHFLPKGWTTVGIKVDVEHMRPTPMGGMVEASATLVKTEGRKLEFSVQASDDSGLIGQGRHTRFIINRKKFAERL
ncbi:MAG: dihydrolipoamide acyltransferase [Candidatus Aminicenantes bacterium]|nr:dihydrolipoamide acyltransferase [Candidatus Aminicenantes bacterium]